MQIEKKPREIDNALCRDFYYFAARAAMKDFIVAYSKRFPGCVPMVYLPAYIGVSPKEGSGIFDPLTELAGEGLIEYGFYRVDRWIHIDYDDLEKEVESLEPNRPFLVLRVNYFGFQDPCSEDIYNLVDARGGIVLEDDAHGFMSFQRAGSHWAHAAFFSLHKQFAFTSGGQLRILSPALFDLDCTGEIYPHAGVNPWEYDLGTIADKCRCHFKYLETLSCPYVGLWTPMRSLKGDALTVPQTFPVLLKNADRFTVYEKMNKLGYGVTSLYHTMVDPIRSSKRYLDSSFVSQRILNLPVHQDIDEKRIRKMVASLVSVCEACLDTED